MNDTTQKLLEFYSKRIADLRYWFGDSQVHVNSDQRMAVQLYDYAAALEAVNAELLAAAKAFFEWFDSVDGTTAQGVQARNQLRAIVAKVKEPNHVK